MMRMEDLLRRLGELPVAETQEAALAAAGEHLADAVRQVLSVGPGGVHDAPWSESGMLRESIEVSVQGNTLLVGSIDPVAADQERGTRTVPARPFLGPAGAALGRDVAGELGARFAALLRSDG